MTGPALFVPPPPPRRALPPIVDSPEPSPSPDGKNNKFIQTK